MGFPSLESNCEPDSTARIFSTQRPNFADGIYPLKGPDRHSADGIFSLKIDAFNLSMGDISTLESFQIYR